MASILTLGIGTLILIFAASGAVSAWQVRGLVRRTESLTGAVSAARAAAFEVEINAVELAAATRVHVLSGDSVAARRAAADRGDLLRFQAQLRQHPATAEAARLLDGPVAAFVAASDTLFGTRSDGGDPARLVARFGQLEARLDTLLDRTVQPRVERYRAGAAHEARAAARRAALWTTLGLLVSLPVGIAVSTAILRTLTLPLRALVAAADDLGAGNLGRRAGRLPAAEFDRLGHAFDRMAAELSAALAQVEAARRAAEQASVRKTEFVSEVSHELRTPLTAIRAALGLLSASAATLPPASARLVEVAKRNSERLGPMIDETLDLDRIEAGAQELHPTVAGAGDLVGAALEATRPRAEERRVRLAEEVPSGLSVQADAGQAERVLINLVSNAVKYAPPGSVVSVRVCAEPGAARFEVEDTGPGIPTAHQPRIFQRFARAGGSGDPGGTGLGLALARAIVERHGGAIGFESVPGRTRFWFTLPEPPEAAARSRDGGPPALRG